jgi:hypothetical protein
LNNPSCRYSLKLNPKTTKALVPDVIMNTIVEAAKVSATIRDLYVQEIISVPKKEFNPSRRDSNC